MSDDLPPLNSWLSLSGIPKTMILATMLKHYPRHSMQAYANATDSIDGNDRHLALVLTISSNVLREGASVNRIAKVWDEAGTRLIAGKNSEYYNITRRTLWELFVQRVDERAGGIIASAEIRCLSLKANKAKENCWGRAWTKLTHLMQIKHPPEIAVVVKPWDSIAMCYHTYYKSGSQSFVYARDVYSPGLSPPE